jgi:calcium-dependent protein kinase
VLVGQNETKKAEPVHVLLRVLQVLRRKYGKEADIWSCGVMLYILLSGMPPFYGDNEQQIFDAILRNKVDFESDPWPKVSAPAKVGLPGLLVFSDCWKVSVLLGHPAILQTSAQLWQCLS